MSFTVDRARQALTIVIELSWAIRAAAVIFFGLLAFRWLASWHKRKGLKTLHHLSLDQLEVQVDGIPGVCVAATWKPSQAERRAAWELYVELVTRTTIVPLGDDEGLLREALDSYHSIFATTRRILREYGPEIGVAKTDGQPSLGSVAVAILNQVLRPVLARWHPILADYEARRPSGTSGAEHEQKWDRAGELRQALNEVRATLHKYAECLERVAGTSSFISK